ncbi:MAG: hypothetical protein ACRDRA_07925 [Pseudonocardiaceae bacterium]
MNEQHTVSPADARRIIDAGEAKATEIGQPSAAWQQRVVVVHGGV